MGMADLQRALQLVQKIPGKAHFAGPKPESLVLKAEQALGRRFPPTYREFLLRLGCGSFDGEEFYGVVDEDFENSAIPDAIWFTLEERASGNLPEHLVVIYDTGFEHVYAIDTSKTNDQDECPIVAWLPGESTSDSELEVIASDFGEFFYHLVQEALS